MKLVADENMPDLSLFSDMGRVVTVAGRAITPRLVADADVLLVRSVTRVDAELLAGSDVRWVGTATIGTDHLDLDWLATAGIEVASAPGCNAMAVVEYVLQAMLLWARGAGRALHGARLGVVGMGNVGRRVAALGEALGMKVVVNDPPRAARGDLPETGSWQPLEAVLECDVVTLHVPLTRDGEWPTWHLLSAQPLAGLGAGQCLVNTCRGAVIDNTALLERLQAPQPPTVVLDVWEDEPQPMASLVRAVTLGTPHVAGYSVEGKRRGTAMLWQQLCSWRGLFSDPEPVLAPQARADADVTCEADLLALLQRRHRLVDDHHALLASLEAEDPGAAFDALRRNYRQRHECAGLQVRGAVAPQLAGVLAQLGVRFAAPDRAAGNTQ